MERSDRIPFVHMCRNALNPLSPDSAIWHKMQLHAHYYMATKARAL